MGEDLSSGFLIRFNTNRDVQPQKKAAFILGFRMLRDEKSL